MMKISQSLKEHTFQSKYLPTAIIENEVQEKIQTVQNSKAIEQKNGQNQTSKLLSQSKKQVSLIKKIKSLFMIPTLILLFYFVTQMLIISIFYLSQDIYSAFSRFFSSIKLILQQNTLLLLFWSIIIIKTKIPQLQRVCYHTIVRTILVQEQDNQCSICLGQDCDYILPKCRHNFHAICLQKWVKNNPYCPYCRTIVGNKLVRKVPWEKFLQNIKSNKLKWMIVFGVFSFVQYRFYYCDIFPLTIKQKE